MICDRQERGPKSDIAYGPPTMARRHCWGRLWYQTKYVLISACFSRKIWRREVSISHGQWRSCGLRTSWHHLFHGLFESASPCLLCPPPPPPLSSAVFWQTVHCCMCGPFTLQSEDVANHFPLLVLKDLVHPVSIYLHIYSNWMHRNCAWMFGPNILFINHSVY